MGAQKFFGASRAHCFCLSAGAFACAPLRHIKAEIGLPAY
jgi:hypothetical protein